MSLLYEKKLINEQGTFWAVTKQIILPDPSKRASGSEAPNWATQKIAHYQQVVWVAKQCIEIKFPNTHFPGMHMPA